tara:strand:+ start:1537 stop:2349 length:813 start_codon:yes stop_codon:yes gene_type:complete
MKVIILCGKNENQKALVNKIANVACILGIVIEKKKTKSKTPFFDILMKITNKLFFHKIDKSWNLLMEYYSKKFPLWPKSNQLFVENINYKEVVDYINNLKCDLIIVSGTRLIKKSSLEKFQSTKGIINLHTGISPYVKGGPNCTNWCIAENNFHLIGNTIMWIDSGIDSGNILTTERTILTGNENLNQIHIKVMEHAHELYLRSIMALNEKKNVPNVKQKNIASGKTYLTKEWNFKNKVRLIYNMSSFNKSKLLNYNESSITLIPIKTIV